jgi:hypothetical protein
MKNRMTRLFALLGIPLMMTLSVAAQEEPKIKTSDKENKYKSEDLKIKDKKDEVKYKSEDHKIKDKKDEVKYKSDDVKIKEKKDEVKYKSEEVKVKDKKDERKIKAKVTPMQKTATERTVMKTGETNVRTKEHLEPVSVEPAEAEPTVAQAVAVPEVSKPVKKTATRKSVAGKNTVHKPTAVHKNSTRPKYIVRTKVVRDTVLVPSPPEKVVSTEYVHDTVTITRVDTVVKTKTQNTYSGYAVPKGNFKKVKLKRDENGGDVWMKRKEKDGKTKTEKLKQE